MPLLAVSGAVLACPFGLAPATLNVLPDRTVLAGSLSATAPDMQPLVNIPSFGMCASLANPAVAAATSAALGVLTPAPCVPNIVAPWVPGSSRVLISGRPALHQGCTCSCLWGGVIRITAPGQPNVQVT